MLIFYDLHRFSWIYVDLYGFPMISMDLHGLKRFWGRSVGRPLAVFGGLWTPVLPNRTRLDAPNLKILDSGGLDLEAWMPDVGRIGMDWRLQRWWRGLVWEERIGRNSHTLKLQELGGFIAWPWHQHTREKQQDLQHYHMQGTEAVMYIDSWEVVMLAQVCFCTGHRCSRVHQQKTQCQKALLLPFLAMRSQKHWHEYHWCAVVNYGWLY